MPTLEQAKTTQEAKESNSPIMPIDVVVLALDIVPEFKQGTNYTSSVVLLSGNLTLVEVERTPSTNLEQLRTF